MNSIWEHSVLYLQLLCKSKSIPRIFKNQQKQKIRQKKFGPQISSMYITWKLVSNDDQNPFQICWIGICIFQKILRLIIECTITVEKPCSLPQAGDIASAQHFLGLKHAPGFLFVFSVLFFVLFYFFNIFVGV